MYHADWFTARLARALRVDRWFAFRFLIVPDVQNDSALAILYFACISARTRASQGERLPIGRQGWMALGFVITLKLMVPSFRWARFACGLETNSPSCVLLLPRSLTFSSAVLPLTGCGAMPPPRRTDSLRTELSTPSSGARRSLILSTGLSVAILPLSASMKLP
jgi:hypothetical protein